MHLFANVYTIDTADTHEISHNFSTTPKVVPYSISARNGRSNKCLWFGNNLLNTRTCVCTSLEWHRKQKNVHKDPVNVHQIHCRSTDFKHAQCKWNLELTSFHHSRFETKKNKRFNFNSLCVYIRRRDAGEKISIEPEILWLRTHKRMKVKNYTSLSLCLCSEK